VIYGPPGCGKSFLALDVGMRVACGTKFFGKHSATGAVVYVAAEAAQGMGKRIVAACTNMSVERTDVPLGLVTSAPNLGKSSIDCDLLIGSIKHQQPLLNLPIKLVVIDTLARTLQDGDENSSSEMNAFIAKVDRIAEAFECLVIVVHHSGKDGARGMRGSSALHGAADVEWCVSKSGNSHGVELVKQKEGESGQKWTFSLGVLDVSDDPDGKPITSCFVIEKTLPEIGQGEALTKKADGIAEKVMDAIIEAADEYAEKMPDNDELPDSFGIPRSKIKEACINHSIGNAENPKSQETTINRALDDLTKRGKIGKTKGWIWIIEENSES
jgi:hypothetical protein